MIRRAEAGDAATLSLVASATFLDAFAGILDGIDIVAHCAGKNDTATFGRWIAGADSVVTLAEAPQGKAPVGYTVLAAPDLPVETRPDDIELKRIYALSRFHGTGLGAALMDRALTDAQVLGCKRMLLGVYGKNNRARSFYERHGFALAGERRFLIGGTRHEDLLYARSL